MGKEVRQKIFNSAKIITLDSYRTYVSLAHSAYEIALAAILIAGRYMNVEIPLKSVVEEAEKDDGIKVDLESVSEIIQALNQLLRVNLPSSQ